MASKLPYMASPGKVRPILEKIREARRPDRFTTDFLETKLGHSGGASRPIIPLLKRLGFVGSDGIPTALYDRFRNEGRGPAMAEGIKRAYSELYDRNEYAHDLTKEKLAGLITEITGAAKDDSATRHTVSTFTALKEFADFDASEEGAEDENIPDPGNEQVIGATNELNYPPMSPAVITPENVRLAMGYTINLNLPETTNPEVFNAIFKALSENLLKG